MGFLSVSARHRTARGALACVSGHMPGPPEDVVAFTSAHSRSYTALAAMHRLGLRPRCRGVLRLLCLGADRREGTSPESTAAVFGALRGDARRRGAFPGRERTQGWTYDEVMRGVERVEIVLVGPNVTLETRVTPNVFHDVFHDARDDDGAPRLPTRVAYLRGLYHELATNTGALLVTDTEWVPDLALAYNAGVWGYAQSEWAPTFFALTRDARAPVACTGYSLAELENDEAPHPLQGRSLDRRADLRDQAVNPSTRTRYDAAWRGFLEWRRQRADGGPVVEGEPTDELVGAYVQHLFAGRKTKSEALAVAAACSTIFLRCEATCRPARAR